MPPVPRGLVYVTDQARGIRRVRLSRKNSKKPKFDYLGASGRRIRDPRTLKRIVAELQARGMKSPYLRSYVVARINPVRFHKIKAGDKKPVMPIAQALLRMLASAKKFDLGKVNLSDLAFVAAGAESAD